MRNALNSKPIRPITILKRDQPGYRGEPIGTYTCIPRECDEIVTRAWATIYDGNSKNTNALIHHFCKQYAPHIFTSKSRDVQPLTGPQLKDACTNCNLSAGGLDHFSPEDMQYLTDDAYEWIATMLKAIEEGAQWPTDLTQGRAAFLSKDSHNTEDPLACRVLLILPTIYRRWATTRLKSLQSWIYLWQRDDMFAGVEGAAPKKGGTLLPFSRKPAITQH